MSKPRKVSDVILLIAGTVFTLLFFVVALFNLQPWIQFGIIFIGKIQVIPGQSLILNSPVRPGIVRIMGLALLLFSLRQLWVMKKRRELTFWSGVLWTGLFIFGFNLLRLAVPLLENLGTSVGTLMWTMVQSFQLAPFLVPVFFADRVTPELMKGLWFAHWTAYLVEVTVCLWRFPPYANGDIDVITRHLTTGTLREAYFQPGNVVWLVVSVIICEGFVQLALKVWLWLQGISFPSKNSANQSRGARHV